MQQKPQTASQLPVRLRFAPSPTGHLHVGGARTALFNWLWARKLGGTFVLRIEDTDTQRSTEESLRGILDGMRWLGLHWDEGPGVGGAFGPYQQTLRQVLYHAEADRLQRERAAYRCFCSREALEAMRARGAASGGAQRYDGTCRDLDHAAAAARADAGETHVIRLRMPTFGEVGWTDLVRGDFRFDCALLDDFVLVKSDGNPTYNFAVVVDDVKMRISHVIRGDDHISNTPRQLALFDALGYPRPEFGHLPMILGPDKTRLSKRHGATSVTQFRDLGILPQAMLNYLALLGWSLDGEREFFSMQELVTHFELHRVSRNPAVFDTQKLLWMNREYFGRLSLGEKIDNILPQMRAQGLWPPGFRVDLVPRHFRVVTGTDEDKVAASILPLGDDESHAAPSFAEELPRLGHVLEAVGSRLGGPHDVVEQLGYFYSDDFAYDSEAVAKHLESEDAAAHLAALADAIEALAAYTPETLESALRDLAAVRGVKAGVIIHPARVALTGRSASPGIFDLLYLLGRAKSVERLRRGRDIVRSNRALPLPAVLDAGASPAGLAPPEPPPGDDAGIELATQWSDDRPPDDG